MLTDIKFVTSARCISVHKNPSKSGSGTLEVPNKVDY